MDAASTRESRPILALLALGLLTLAWAYQGTFLTVLQKWRDDAAFSHGFLILPISLWLGWQKREELARVELGPSWAGVLAIVVAGLLWVVGRCTGALFVEQVAAVALIQAAILAIVGWPATRASIFPLAFLYFAVPFGRGIVPLLMQATADMATWFLQLTGVPVFRSNMYISIPSGNFEVARACSGLNYVVTGLVLGTLYAYLTYAGWKKRLLCLAAFLVVPIVANGLRVYITILVSHLTEMRFGPGTEHVTFGKIFFILVMLLMFWWGRRWRDVDVAADTDRSEGVVQRPDSPSPGRFAAVPVVLAALLWPPYFAAASVRHVHSHLGDPATLAGLPRGVDQWRGPVLTVDAWRPLYEGGVARRQGRYSRDGEPPLDVFVAVYGLGTSFGTEMISYGNMLQPEEHVSLAKELLRSVELPTGAVLQVREMIIRGADGQYLVWTWFMVGRRPVLSGFAVKAIEAVALFVRQADSERIVTLATPMDSNASERLRSFVLAYPGCVSSGFSVEACGK